MIAARGMPHTTGRLWRETALASAFTLIEVSVVLLVIALLVGGILVGRDLVRAAEIRQAVGQVEKFDAAVNAFRTKYNCLPGDCANAAEFGFDPTSSGNGDGVIGQSYDGPCDSSNADSCPLVIVHEYIDFWYHLGSAGLIGFPAKPMAQLNYGSLNDLLAGKHTPPIMLTPSSGGALPAPGNGWAITANMWLLSNQQFMPGHNFLMATTAAAFYQEMARHRPATTEAIDTKLDDGLPLSGKARAWSLMTDMSYATAPPSVPGSARCLTSATTPPSYNVLYVGNATSGLCALAIKASF